MGNPVESWLWLLSCGLAHILSKISAKYSDSFLVCGWFFSFLFMLAFYLAVPYEFKAVSLI